jgi:hypothetical protein
VAGDNSGEVYDYLFRINLFVIGSDHAVYHITQSCAGTCDSWAFENLGGYVIGNPATGIHYSSGALSSIPDGALELFVVGSD